MHPAQGLALDEQAGHYMPDQRIGRIENFVNFLKTSSLVFLFVVRRLDLPRAISLKIIALALALALHVTFCNSFRVKKH